MNKISEMSFKVDEEISHIDNANVGETEENVSKSISSSDPVVENLQSKWASYPSGISPVNIDNILKLAREQIDSGAPDISSELPTSTLHSEKGKDFILYTDDNRKDDRIKNMSVDSSNTIDVKEVQHFQNVSHNSVSNESITEIKQLNLNDNALTMSTSSLNEQLELIQKPINLHSRSVENISMPEPLTNLNTSSKELDSELILSELTSHKTITQKIVPENSQILDVRYTRLPKEILSQDLGSIVKNVHGIFSSVSGSLKNAYNNSQIIQKPLVKNVRPIANGNIMNDIFDDSTTEKPKESVTDISNLELNVNCQSESLVNPDDEKVNVPVNEMHILQIESLERVLFEQRKENASLRERVKQQVNELQAKDLAFKELEAKIDLLSKRAEQSQREKDAAVMRYASVECTAIEAKRAAETAAKAERAAVTERELLNAKLKTAREEKQRICQLYDDKCHELQAGEREAARLREELRELEGRLRWTQSKLRMEMDVCKDSTERVEKLTQQVSELEAAKESAIANSPDSAKAKQLESELKESRAALILCRHEKEDSERRLNAALQQLDTCRRERDDNAATLQRVQTEIESLKQSNVRLEEEAAELAALRARAALADTLGHQLQRETERACAAERALSAERARAETCSRREASALEHAARLTAQHVASRARAAEHEAKAQALAADNASLRETVAALQEETEKSKALLEEETERRHRENRVLARKVAELSEEVAEAAKKLEWEKGDNNVLKKKHASAAKELNRELQRALRRIEQLEARLSQHDAVSTGAESVSSLSSGDAPASEERARDLHAPGDAPVAASPDPQVREPDRRALVERIVSLQRAAAARAERCEFLQEHCAQLTGELRTKSRLLRAVLPALPPAALASAGAEEHKKEIARFGGAMAAVWGGDPAGLPPQLALEMNRRLQAVLEDALLKNITLKENMDTLGEEISRLREQIKNNDTK